MSSPATPTLVERLFKAGAHFGFKKSRRHPTVTPYLFATKQGNDIFDLEHSAALIESAKETLKGLASQNKNVLFVGTKEEIAKLVLATAEKLGAPYVVNRWIGGMLTNWNEIKKRIARMTSLAHERESGELDRKYTKKERVILGREAEKLATYFGGISSLTRLPDALVVVDPRHDAIAVAEARFMKIPVIGIMSSDCDVSLVTHPIVVNDALQSSVSAVLAELAAAYVEGRESAASAVEAPAASRPAPTA